jgi:hypothetical protein
MSDDLFESFGDEDLFLDEEEEELSGEAEGEGQNRTFIIAVAVLGGLLVCALAAFGVWAFVISPRQARNQASEALPSPTVTVEAEETIEATPTEEIPTDTPEPEPTNTPTPVVGPTRTPTPEVTATVEGTPEEGETEGAGAEIPGEGADEGGGEDEDVTPTPRPRRTATPRPTPTTRSEPAAGDATGLDEDEELSQTGLGEWLLAGAALLLFGVAILARRLRST